MSEPLRARWLLWAALLVTIVVYWPGLHGPFLLDDTQNLHPINDWLAGAINWQEAVFGNGSGPLGRPLSMASFLINASIGGTDAFSFKIGNLFIHLASGLLAWQVLRRLLHDDPRMKAHADVTATIIAALWLLHPFNASTVLYAVQRMAQLSALFILVVLLIYIKGRRALAAGKLHNALIYFFVLIPVLLAAGILSKETVAVAPIVCLAIEFSYYRNWPRRKNTLTIFYGLFLWLPLLAVSILLLLHPHQYLDPHELWGYGIRERLLTESRALSDYLSQIILPDGPRMGLYHDDFVVSTKITRPITTLWALLGLLAATGLAIYARPYMPSVFAGWFWFIAGHALESGILPMDSYFEHRNYFPSIGILLCAVSILVAASRHLKSGEQTKQRFGYMIAGAFCLIFAVATLGRSLTWQSKLAIATEGLKRHPQSLRAAIDMATIWHESGNFKAYTDIMDGLKNSPAPRSRMLAYASTMTLTCARGLPIDIADLHLVVLNAPRTITMTEVNALRTLARVSRDKRCAGLEPTQVANAITRIVDRASTQPDNAKSKWVLRHTASELYLADQNWQMALPQSRLAWQPSADPAAGALLLRIYIATGQSKAAKDTFQELAPRINRYNHAQVQELHAIEEAMRVMPSHSPSAQP